MPQSLSADVPAAFTFGKVESLSSRQRLCTCIGGALLFLTIAVSARSAEYFATPATYRNLLSALKPGDTLTLAPGTYFQGLPLHYLVGSAEKAIIIQGPRPPLAAQFIAQPGRHTVSIVNSAYVEVHSLELNGNGLGVAAVRCEGTADWAHHITLQNLSIHGHGRDQSTVGIGSFCPAWDWVIRENRIVGAGTGIYLGQSNGTAPFVAGTIERNLIVDSIGYNLQIKHQRERPGVAGMPTEKSLTIIRHNVFSKSSNSSHGILARPNVLVGHWPPAGPGVDDTYAIYGNLFYQNPSEALFQGEGNIAFYSNVLINFYRDAIHIQPHNAVPRSVDVFHNTVIAANNGIRVTGGEPAHWQRVYANAVFSRAPIAGGEKLANITGSLEAAADFLAAPYMSLEHLDLAPKSGKLNTEAHDLTPQSRLPDVNRDFEGRTYQLPVAGAYAAEALHRLTLEIMRH